MWDIALNLFITYQEKNDDSQKTKFKNSFLIAPAKEQ